MSVLRHPFAAFCLLAALSVAAVMPAQAQQDDDRRDRDRDAERSEDRDAQRAPRQRQQDAMSDSIRRIERSTRGQVLSAERMQSDGRDINRIKVVDDRGRVRIYMDDPQRQQRPPPTRDDDD